MLANLSGNPYGHYYLSLIPVGCLLSAFTIKLLLDVFRTRFSWIPLPLTLLVVTAFTYVHYMDYLIHDNILQRYANWGGHIGCCDDNNYVRGNEDVINHIRENTDEDDHILVWGAEGGIYFLSDRTAPTRFFYQYPLFRQGYANNDLIKEFTSDVVGSPPAIIIDTHDPKISISLNMADPERRYPEQLQPFIEFVDTHYERLKIIGSNDIYHHKK